MFHRIKNIFIEFFDFIRSPDRLFWLLLIIFIGIPILHFSYVPIWDGWEFMGCYIDAALRGSLWCFDHSAFVHTYFFGLTQKIDLGNFKLVYAANIILGIIGLLAFRSLLKCLFGDRLSSTNLTLLTFVFGLTPVFLVHTIQPSLDYTLPIFFVILLLFLFQKRFVLAGAAGILLVFTKESGFMLYGVSVFLYAAFLMLKGLSWPKKERNLIRLSAILLIPILLFVIYMILVPSTQIGGSWIEGIKKMVQFYLLDKVILGQLISAFVINFMWIISLFILINVILEILNLFWGKWGRGNAVIGFSSRYERIYFYILSVAVVYFLTRIPFVNNPRYMLPVLPLLIILFADSLLIVLRKQRYITLALAVFLILITVSSFRTVDPVARALMGTFRFGSHNILWMSSFDEIVYGYGRDQLVYNFEFTNFHYLTERIFRELGWDNVYVVSPNVTWKKNFNTFDIRTGRRHIYGDDVKMLSFLYSNYLVDSASPPREIYFISYPHLDMQYINETQRVRLANIYDLEETITFERGGYSIDVYHYILKDI